MFEIVADCVENIPTRNYTATKSSIERATKLRCRFQKLKSIKTILKLKYVLPKALHD